MAREQTGTPDASGDEALRRECLRLYRRYAVEIVEAFGFCPYAERCRLEGGTREVVLTTPELDLELALETAEALARDERVEIGLVLWPRVRTGRRGLSTFVEAVRAAHQRRPGGLVMAMEGFHPDAEADLGAPERLVPFVRRTPDPTIQLVRHAVLERVRRGSPQGTAFFDPRTMPLEDLETPSRPLHERIAEANLATVRREGVAGVEERLLDIFRDRDRTYAALGERRSSTRPPNA